MNYKENPNYDYFIKEKLNIKIILLWFSKKKRESNLITVVNEYSEAVCSRIPAFHLKFGVEY